MAANRESAPAVYVEPETFRAGGRSPGEFTVITSEEGKRYLMAVVPGGHMASCHLQPESSQGWQFNEDLERPSLTPSVRVTAARTGGESFEAWHGFLTNGEWRSC